MPVRLTRLASGEPSRFIQQHAALLDASLPVLDAPCGFGRNGLFLAKQGYQVVGADIDHRRIQVATSRANSEPHKNNLRFVICDLDDERSPFAQASLGALLIVHFIPRQWSSLSLLTAGGYLLFETMGGQGENYLQLPRVGQMRALLEPGFAVSHYDERPVGPAEANAAAVRLVARKL